MPRVERFLCCMMFMTLGLSDMGLCTPSPYRSSQQGHSGCSVEIQQLGCSWNCLRVGTYYRRPGYYYTFALQNVVLSLTVKSYLSYIHVSDVRDVSLLRLSPCLSRLPVAAILEYGTTRIAARRTSGSLGVIVQTQKMRM